MPISSLLRSVAICFAVCASGVACTSILGIEPAECSPDYAECKTVSPLCDTYCNTIMSACSGSLVQYFSVRNCLAVCDTLPPGKEGDAQVNSVQCRLTQAIAAQDIQDPNNSEKVATCAGAGPEGYLACGDICQAVCSITDSVCKGSDNYFSPPDDCETNCKELASTSMPFNAFSDSPSGPTPECRLWHACAATESPSVHCQHAEGQSTCK
jgi:hypothetical protein